MKKKLFIVALILTLITLGFGVTNYAMVTQATKEETTQFENKISELEKGIKDEKKESKISSINGLKELEKELEAFNKKVLLVTVNKESFKDQTQKVSDKIKEAIESLTALYKSTLDANVKDPNTTSKEELNAMITNLDSLVKEIRDDKMLTEEQIKPFEDKTNEMKPVYANKIKEIEEAEAKARAEAEAKAKAEAQAQAQAQAQARATQRNGSKPQSGGSGANTGNGSTSQSGGSGGGNILTVWDVDANGNKIPGTTSTFNKDTGILEFENGDKHDIRDWAEVR